MSRKAGDGKGIALFSLDGLGWLLSKSHVTQDATVVYARAQAPLPATTLVLTLGPAIIFIRRHLPTRKEMSPR